MSPKAPPGGGERTERGDEPAAGAVLPDAALPDATLPAAVASGSGVEDPGGAPGGPGEPGEAEGHTVAPQLYRMIAEEGRGGLGRVLRARDKRTGRLVALKEMLGDSREAAARFRREAIVTANLQHPSIVPVYEVGRWPDGSPFYAMKLVEGRTLRSVIEEAGTLTGRLGLLPNVIAIADALSYAHSRRIIHRDLKPANILVGQFGETIVIDWGLAKDLSAADDDRVLSGGGPGGGDDLTRDGAVMGTPGYMAPEQAQGRPVDERADVYALGGVLYHVLSGAMPYAGSDAVLDLLIAGPPAPLPAEVPPELRAICERAMSRDPADRYPSASELAEELRRYQAGKLVTSHSYTLGQLVARWVRRHRAAVAVSLAAMVALFVAIGVGYQRAGAERDAAERQRAAAEEARAVAADARDLARRRLARVHAELGRHELASGAPLRAVVHLVEAAEIVGPGDPALAHLIGRALEGVESRVAWHPGHDTIGATADRPGRHFTATVGFGGVAVLWSLADGTPRRLAGEVEDPQDVHVTARGEIFLVHAHGVSRYRDAHSDPEVFAGAEAGITRVVSSPAGDWVALGSRDGTLALHRLDGDRPPLVWHADPLPITQLVVSADGTRLASSSAWGRVVSLWRTDTGARVTRRLSDVDGEISAAPDRPRLAVVSDRGHVLDSESGRVIAEFAVPGRVNSLLYAPGDRVLTSTMEGEVTLWSGETGSRIADMPAHGSAMPTFFAASADGVLLASSRADGTVGLWSARTGAVAGRLHARGGPLMHIAFGDSGLLVGVEHEGAGWTWEVDRARYTRALEHAAETRRVAYDPAGERIATGSIDGTITLWSTDGAEVASLRGHRGRITWLSWSPTGDRLLSASDDHTARVWDLGGGVVATTLEGHGAPLKMARWSRDGRRVITAGDDGTARVWSAGDGSPICSVQTGGKTLGVALSHGGDLVLSFGEADRAAIWKLDDCELVRTLVTGHVATLRGAFSPDDARVVLTGYALARSGAVGAYAFDVAGSGEAARFAGFDDEMVAGLAFHPNGSLVALGSGLGKVGLWDLGSRSRIADCDGVGSTIGDLAFTPDGEFLIAGTDAGQLLVWETRTCGLIEELTGHDSGVYLLDVRPDGRQLASAALDPSPRLWSLPRWEGDAVELRDRLRCSVPWRLEGDRLVTAEISPVCGPGPGE